MGLASIILNESFWHVFDMNISQCPVFIIGNADQKRDTFNKLFEFPETIMIQIKQKSQEGGNEVWEIHQKRNI